MGMWTTENQDTMADVLRKFSEASDAAYSHAYEAGYLQSTVIQMLRHLPKREQKSLIESFVRSTQRLEQIAIQRQKEVDSI